MSVEERERKGFQKKKKKIWCLISSLSPLISFDSLVTHSTTRICLIRENERKKKRETDRRGNETGLENSLDQNKCFQLFDLVGFSFHSTWFPPPFPALFSPAGFHRCMHRVFHFSTRLPVVSGYYTFKYVVHSGPLCSSALTSISYIKNGCPDSIRVDLKVTQK